jgi:hypothetical protein
MQRWVMIGLLFVLLVIIIVVVFLALWFLRQQNDDSGQATSRGETTFNNPFKTFKTDYFKFKTDKSWKYVPEESTPSSFVYRSSKNKLVLRDLTVYINTIPSNILLTRVLAADAGKTGFKSIEISPHCKDVLPSGYLDSSRNPVDVTMDGVTFACQVDSSQTTIGTGTRGGGLGASLSRKNGSRAQYFLLYHDLEFTPKTSVFEDIVEQFQSL